MIEIEKPRIDTEELSSCLLLVISSLETLEEVGSLVTGALDDTLSVALSVLLSS